MIINYIKLKNIRSYKNETINFPTGKVLLVGDVGAGKSTILLSIEFALFGIMKGDISGETLLRKGEKNGSVELSITVDNREYIIKRTLKKGKNSISQKEGYLIANSTKYELTPNELRSKIFNILGYSSESISKSKTILYRYTVYTPQEKMKEILFQKDEDRIDTIRHIFKLDKYKKIITNASIASKKIRDKRLQLEGFTSDIDSKLEKLKESTTKIETEKEKLKEIKSKAEEIERKTNEVKTKKEQLDKLDEERKKLENKAEILSNKIKTHIEQISSLNKNLDKNSSEIEKLKEKLKEIKEEHKIDSESELKSEIKNKINELSSKIKEKEELIRNKLLEKNNLENEQKYLKKELEDIEKDQNKKSELKKQASEKENQVNQFIKEIKDYEDKIEKLNKIKDKLEALQEEKYLILNETKKNTELMDKIESMNQCPLCLQEVTSEHKNKIKKEKTIENKENQTKLNKINSEIESINNSIQELESLKNKHATILTSIEWTKKQITDINQQINTIDESIKKIDIIKDKIENNKNRINEINKINFEDIKKEIENAKEHQKILYEIDKINSLMNEKERNIKETAESIKSIKAEIGKINIERRDINNQIQKLKESLKDYSQIKEEYETKQNELNEIKSDIKSKENEIKLLDSEYQNLKKEIDEKKKAIETTRKLKAIETWLSESFSNTITTIEKHILSKVYNEFNEYFIKWLSLLVNNENISGSLDENFKPVIEQNGYNIRIENLSGGEKTSIALSYRLALNRAINNLVDNIKTKDIIILDEPTDGFSTEQLDRVRDVLNELKVKQMIIVSHETKIESFVNNIIRIAKDNNISKVIQI